MDDLRRHTATLVNRWQGLARGQQLACMIVLGVSLVGLVGWLTSRSDNWIAVADGREFSAADAKATQAAWRNAGLRSFRPEGRKLLVPSADQSRYLAAMPRATNDGDNSEHERPRSIDKANLFTSPEQLEQLRDSDLRATLRRQLKAIPAIADVDVVWARSKTRVSFASRSKVTATISVLPRAGHDLTSELAQSLRTAVAGMVPDLVAEDIVVLDQSSGLAVTNGSEPQFAQQQTRRQHERIAKQLESRVAATVAHLPNVTVRVERADETPLHSVTSHTVARPTFGSSIEWASEPTAAESPTSEATSADEWQVFVQIPQASFEAHVAQQLLKPDRQSVSLQELRNAEHDRLCVAAQNALPSEAKLADFTIVTDPNVATSEAIAPFAAWPHVVCGGFAVLCLTLATRRPRTTPKSAPHSDTSLPTLATTLSIEKLPEPVRQITVVDEPLPPRATIEPLSNLTRLQQLDPQQLADVLCHERPQAIAVVLTRFPTRVASTCLSRFTPTLQTDVIRRLKSLGEVSDELVAEIAHAVCLRLEPASPEPINRIAHLLTDTSPQRALA